jgi:hypothetical protein
MSIRRLLLLFLFAFSAHAIEIPRLTGPVVVDGALDDAVWTSVPAVSTWYETEPGDNVTPKVRTEGRLAVDGRYLYAAFRFFEDDPAAIRAPFSARDEVAPESDYGGLIVDGAGDGRSAQVFYANPRGVQFDAVFNDATNEQTATPDFFWDAATRIDGQGWTLELRIPFTSLRYSAASPRWRVMLVRNWSRDRRYRIFSAPIPRGSNCMVCHADVVTGLALPPAPPHVTAVPYVSARSGSANARSFDGGADVKYTPTANTAVDLTLRPDFSQVESDALAVTANERFALAYPEKRPFFLEGIQLFDTALPLIATRTITAPDWGARVTHTNDRGGATLLVTADRGGGSVILPRANSSDVATQDFRSYDAIARGKQSWGAFTAGGVATVRAVSGGGSNVVFGPDLQWRGAHDLVTAEWVASRSDTPDRPDLAEEWDGRRLRSHAASLTWQHTTPTWDWVTTETEMGRDFRADLGYIPQVDFRETYNNIGYTIHPRNFFNNIRFYLTSDYEAETDGRLLYAVHTVGADWQGRWASTFRTRLARGRILAGDHAINRDQFLFIAEASPGKRVTKVGFEGTVGQQIDFTNARRGSGAYIHFYGTLQPAARLELSADNNLQFIDRAGGRVFTAQSERLRLTYAFSVASSLRLVVQNLRTQRDPLAYTDAVTSRSGSLGTSILYQYRLNYATALYAGAGDGREVEGLDGRFTAARRTVFVKVSVAR